MESLWHGFEGGLDDNIIGGPLTQYKDTLGELKEITGDNYDGFMPHTWVTKGSGRHLVCHTRDLHAQISSLLGELRPKYAPGQVPHFVKDNASIALSISQYVNQEVNVIQNLIVQVALKLEALEDSYPVDSPERNFITKLKDGLSSVKDIATLVGLIITTAQAVGIDLDKLHIILKALNLS